MRLEKEIVSRLIYAPKEIKVLDLKVEWFHQSIHRQLITVLIKNDGADVDSLDLLTMVKNEHPHTTIHTEMIEDLRIEGLMEIDLKHRTQQLKERFQKSRLERASHNFSIEPSRKNLQVMQDRLRELEELDDPEDDGSLSKSVERLFVELEEGLEEGIRTYPKLDEVLGGGMYGGMLLTIGARPGVGKAHPNHTKIPTPSGYKTIGDLKVGEYVFDRQGKPTKVLGVYPRGKMETYKVTLNDGRSTLTAGDHIWSHFSTSGSGKETLINKTTQEMYELGTHNERVKPSGRIGKHAKFSIPTNGAVRFDKKEHLVDPYVIGALIGDGCLLERTLTISSNDIEVVEKVAKLINAKPRKNHENNFSWSFKMNNPSTKRRFLRTEDVLSDYPDLKTYSHLKEIPEDYLYSDVTSRMRLINGLFDTDGHAQNTGKRLHVGYTTASKKLAEQIRWLLQSCGYLSGVTLDKREGKRTCYNVNVLGQSEELEKLFTLSRKKETVISFDRKKRRHYDRIAIKSIEKTGKIEEVTCISVDNEEQLYLCDDFIVTHNTAYGINLACQAMAKQKDLQIDFFTLEMSKTQMLKRFLSRLTEINSMKLRNPNLNLSKEEKDMIVAKSLEILDTHLRIHDSKFNLNDIERQIRRRHFEAEGKPYIAFIDYLGLIDTNDKRQPRHVQVGEITRLMKILTNELDIPIVLFSQLNREIESRQDKKPNLSDLRESGSVEQDSNCVLFLYQDEETQETVVNVAKNREGFTGDIRYRFLKSKMYFQELDDYGR